MSIKIKVDPEIMQELLDQPGVKENVAQMTPEVLEFFKNSLVREGVYSRYVSERQNASVQKLFQAVKHDNSGV